MDTYIERHFDYVLGPAQDGRLASIAAGQFIECALKISPNAPFVRRSHALRIQYTSNNDQRGLQHILARHYGPDRDQLSQNLIRQSLFSPYFGQLGNPIPQYREIFYPPNGEIRLDVINDGAATLTNLTFYFRGVELYKPGTVASYTYPDRYATFPYTYPVPLKNLAVTQTGNTTVFTVKTDADFVLQALQAGFPLNQDDSGFPVQEVFLQLQDENQKAYSNDYVHADVLCGNSGFPAIYQGPSGIVAPVMAGPNLPGLLYPEIYLKANHNFYVISKRTDSSFANAAQITYPVSFIGQKVFLK